MCHTRVRSAVSPIFQDREGFTKPFTGLGDSGNHSRKAFAQLRENHVTQVVAVVGRFSLLGSSTQLSRHCWPTAANSSRPIARSGLRISASAKDRCWGYPPVR